MNPAKSHKNKPADVDLSLAELIEKYAVPEQDAENLSERQQRIKKMMML